MISCLGVELIVIRKHDKVIDAMGHKRQEKYHLYNIQLGRKLVACQRGLSLVEGQMKVACQLRIHQPGLAGYFIDRSLYVTIAQSKLAL